jgi:glycerophosphoryl diester phosphodiesterase
MIASRESSLHAQRQPFTCHQPLAAGNRPERPLIFAHRGGAKLAPENTLAAFDRGLEAGADGLELDVRLSRDGLPVVSHDATLDRTTDARGPVSAMTARQLAVVDAGYRFSRDGSFPWRGRGLGVPSLTEVLARYPACPLIIEMKVDSEEMARATVDVVRAAGALDRVCLGSFGRRVLEAARSYEPRLATGAAGTETRPTLYRSRIGWTVKERHTGLPVPERRGLTSVVSKRFIRARIEPGAGAGVDRRPTGGHPAAARQGVDAVITAGPTWLRRCRVDQGQGRERVASNGVTMSNE